MNRTFVENRTLPTKIKARYEDCFSHLERIGPRIGSRKNACLYIFYVSTFALILWFLFNPFLAGVGWRYVSQTISLIIIAIGIGHLGALKDLSDLPEKFSAARQRLMGIEDKLGVDLKTNAGDPVEIARALDGAGLEQIEAELRAVDTEISATERIIDRSLFVVYIELFNYVSGEIKIERRESPPKP